MYWTCRTCNGRKTVADGGRPWWAWWRRLSCPDCNGTGRLQPPGFNSPPPAPGKPVTCPTSPPPPAIRQHLRTRPQVPRDGAKRRQAVVVRGFSQHHDS